MATATNPGGDNMEKMSKKDLEKELARYQSMKQHTMWLNLDGYHFHYCEYPEAYDAPYISVNKMSGPDTPSGPPRGTYHGVKPMNAEALETWARIWILEHKEADNA